eukprot:m.17772 g.17772  ORF g.17772 m.17772 type:complete len:1289 (-) comp3273_c0_seq2:68-3934(-)
MMYSRVHVENICDLLSQSNCERHAPHSCLAAAGEVDLKKLPQVVVALKNSSQFGHIILPKVKYPELSRDAIVDKLHKTVVPCPQIHVQQERYDHEATQSFSAWLILIEWPDKFEISVDPRASTPDLAFSDIDARQRSGASGITIPPEDLNIALASVDVAGALAPPRTVRSGGALPPVDFFSARSETESTTLEYKAIAWKPEVIPFLFFLPVVSVLSDIQVFDLAPEAPPTPAAPAPTPAPTPAPPAPTPPAAYDASVELGEVGTNSTPFLGPPRSDPDHRSRDLPLHRDPFGVIGKAIDYTLQYLVEMYTVDPFARPVPGAILLGVTDSCVCAGVPLTPDLAVDLCEQLQYRLSHLFPAPPVDAQVYITPLRQASFQPLCFKNDAVLVRLEGQMTFDSIRDDTGVSLQVAAGLHLGKYVYILSQTMAHSGKFNKDHSAFNLPNIKGKNKPPVSLRVMLVPRDSLEPLEHAIIEITCMPSGDDCSAAPYKVWRNASFRCTSVWDDKVVSLSPVTSWAWLAQRTSPSSSLVHTMQGNVPPAPGGVIVVGERVGTLLSETSIRVVSVREVDTAAAVLSCFPHTVVILACLSKPEFALIDRNLLSRAQDSAISVVLWCDSPALFETQFETLRFTGKAVSVIEARLLSAVAEVADLVDHRSARTATSSLQDADHCAVLNNANLAQPHPLSTEGRQAIKAFYRGDDAATPLPWSLVQCAAVERDQETELISNVQRLVDPDLILFRSLASAMPGCGATATLQRLALAFLKATQDQALVLWVDSSAVPAVAASWILQTVRRFLSLRTPIRQVVVFADTHVDPVVLRADLQNLRRSKAFGFFLLEVEIWAPLRSFGPPKARQFVLTPALSISELHNCVDVYSDAFPAAARALQSLADLQSPLVCFLSVCVAGSAAMPAFRALSKWFECNDVLRPKFDLPFLYQLAILECAAGFVWTGYVEAHRDFGRDLAWLLRASPTDPRLVRLSTVVWVFPLLAKAGVSLVYSPDGSLFLDGSPAKFAELLYDALKDFEGDLQPWLAGRAFINDFHRHLPPWCRLIPAHARALLERLMGALKARSDFSFLTPAGGSYLQAGMLVTTLHIPLEYRQSRKSWTPALKCIDQLVAECPSNVLVHNKKAWVYAIAAGEVAMQVDKGALIHTAVTALDFVVRELRPGHGNSRQILQTIEAICDKLLPLNTSQSAKSKTMMEDLARVSAIRASLCADAASRSPRPVPHAAALADNTRHAHRRTRVRQGDHAQTEDLVEPLEPWLGQPSDETIWNSLSCVWTGCPDTICDDF